MIRKTMMTIGMALALLLALAALPAHADGYALFPSTGWTDTSSTAFNKAWDNYYRDMIDAQRRGQWDAWSGSEAYVPDGYSWGVPYGAATTLGTGWVQAAYLVW